MKRTLYLEGGAIGGDSKELQIRCRAGFRKLLEKCNLKGRMPHLVACGSRESVFDDFKKGFATKGTGDYVGMWVDSEDPVLDIEAAWDHLKRRDKWVKPKRAKNDSVLLMTTCMETMIAADREALDRHYGSKLQHSALPPVVNLEQRGRYEIHDALVRATRNCPNVYAKGKRSFDVLGELAPDALSKHLPSFVRSRRILEEKL